jgi:Fe-S-cluster containining protein
MSLDIAAQVMESYRQIDQDIETFQTETQLHCPTGCGWCCENPNVEATPLEMLPLVLELFQRGEVEGWLQQAEESDFQGQCIFYKTDPFVMGNGRCQVYLWRPTICRLFGFATVTSKAGEVQLAACVRHKAAMPDIVAQTQVLINQKTVHPPNFADISQQIASLEPGFGHQALPINEALKVAVEKVGLYLQMFGQNE